MSLGAWIRGVFGDILLEQVTKLESASGWARGQSIFHNDIIDFSFICIRMDIVYMLGEMKRKK